MNMINQENYKTNHHTTSSKSITNNPTLFFPFLLACLVLTLSLNDLLLSLFYVFVSDFHVDLFTCLFSKRFLTVVTEGLFVNLFAANEAIEFFQQIDNPFR